MVPPRNSEYRAKTYPETAYPAVISRTDGIRAAAGRAAYREEFERNHGPDLDESRDGTESGPAF
jgi:hypothetical protein